jgi:hypothetical protein
MSTPSRIAVKLSDNTSYMSIYCHWDGYPEYMMPILTNNYNDEKIAKKLVGFGSASVIAEKLEPTTDAHSFDKPEKGVCVFYHRDRGERWDWNVPIIHNTREKLLCEYRRNYTYIFENNEWCCYIDGERYCLE